MDALKEEGVVALVVTACQSGWPASARDVSRLAGVKERTARTWLDELVDTGRLESRLYGKTRAYRVCWPEASDSDVAGISEW